MRITWNNVVSPQRNEIVFQGRNHAYGAYLIRTTYSRTMMFILSGICLAVFLGFGAKYLFDNRSDDDKKLELDVTQIDLTPPPIDKTEPPPPPPPPPPVVETIKFVPPVIKEDAKEDEPPPPQEKLQETQVSTQTQEGTGDENIVVPTETGNGPVEEKAPEIFTIVEEMPEYPGGPGEMMKFIQSHIQYPQMEKEAGISGRCFVKFVVEMDGAIGQVEILKGVPGGQALDRESMRVIKAMPKWKPGKNNGKPARVWFNLPINFQIK